MVEPLPNIVEDPIPCNKKGRGSERERKGEKKGRQKAVCVWRWGADSSNV